MSRYDAGQVVKCGKEFPAHMSPYRTFAWSVVSKAGVAGWVANRERILYGDYFDG